MTINPILVIILSLIIIKESITIKKLLGIFCGLFGAATLILKDGGIDFSSSYHTKIYSCLLTPQVMPSI